MKISLKVDDAKKCLICTLILDNIGRDQRKCSVLYLKFIYFKGDYVLKDHHVHVFIKDEENDILSLIFLHKIQNDLQYMTASLD